jgi:alkanesulfonate monooxygenase SsuD/methylene tetrahydromethanopterin reductase-like flavin-dependent oxidoreductase (luciferase family)
MDLLHNKRIAHEGKYFTAKVDGAYELFPHPVQQPHPPIFLAASTERSLGVAGRYGFGTMMSSWTPFAELARQTKVYRTALDQTPQAWRRNGARGHVDIARWVYVAETDAKAKRESEDGIMKNLHHFSSGHTSGYLGTVSKDVGASPRDYDALNKDILLHGSPATVVEKIEILRDQVGANSVMLHYPPWYGQDKALASLELFASEVIPKFRAPAPQRRMA